MGRRRCEYELGRKTVWAVFELVQCMRVFMYGGCRFINIYSIYISGVCVFTATNKKYRIEWPSET